MEEFDKNIDSISYWAAPNIADIKIRPEGLEFRMLQKFTYYRTGISYSKFFSISLEDKDQVMEKKEKSVVGKVVISGLLLGPVWAIVRGMTGLKPGTVKAEMPDLILPVTIGNDPENIQQVVLFSCK